MELGCGGARCAVGLARRGAASVTRVDLSTIHDALRDAGFAVERLLEPGTDDPDAYEERWDSKPELMALVPRTLVVRAVL